MPGVRAQRIQQLSYVLIRKWRVHDDMIDALEHVCQPLGSQRAFQVCMTLSGVGRSGRDTLVGADCGYGARVRTLANETETETETVRTRPGGTRNSRGGRLLDCVRGAKPMLTVEPAGPVEDRTCPDCGAPSRQVAGRVLDELRTLAMWRVTLVVHDDMREAWTEVTLGSWDSEVGDHSDHVTFYCRTGPVSNGPGPQSTLFSAADFLPPTPLRGRLLSREEALEHPRLRRFWQISDLVLDRVPAVSNHVYRG
jgi:hypothetical protein